MITWLLHEAIFKDRLTEMVNVVSDRGDKAIILSGRNPELPEPSQDPTIGIVTLQVARKIYKDGRLLPGVFWSPSAFDQTTWSSYFGKWMLNDEIVWLPWSEFVRRGPTVWNHVSVENKVFIRPSSGFKVFTGQLISLINFTEDCKALYATSGVTDETMVGVCSPKPIDNDTEWRFWLGRDGVITFTPYSWTDAPTEISPPDLVLDFANEIVNEQCRDEMSWRPDRIFVADFCLSDGKAKLIELNSASCSGVYNADLVKLADGFSAAVEADINYE